MRILIEEHQYQMTDELRKLLADLHPMEDIQGRVTFNYVGYFYSPHLDDCVFVLPKVLLEVDDESKKERVFHRFSPEELFNLKSCELNSQEQNFIYQFSVWIYRAIEVFMHANKDKSSIVLHKHVMQMSRGRKRVANTYFEIIKALIDFNRENQSFFFFILRNIHSGVNKINWTKTIAHEQACIGDGSPVYLRMVNRKRQINFDEELLVIFFSILNYLREKYGFPVSINCHYELIAGHKFENYLKGFGKRRLQQIKYKYFSDKALELWNLCYAFFDKSKQVRVNSNQQDYLLVKNFNIVFEAMIDELIGDKDLPKGLKDQDDGKLIDHLYTYFGLTHQEEQQEKEIYYIGDSKYYKLGNPIGKESVYKQFTYARNVIQWNLNLFMSDEHNPEDEAWKQRVPVLRDNLTEGYNVIPNFFISAFMNKDYKYEDNIGETSKTVKVFTSTQFRNRLFDRDTLLVCHYDINFLFVVALYARNNALQKREWKEKVRRIFRKKSQEKLNEYFGFYAMKPYPNVDAEKYLKSNFQEVLGKIYRPFTEVEDDTQNSQLFSLALQKKDEKGHEVFEEENNRVLNELGHYFYIVPCALGDDPRKNLQKKIAETPIISILPKEAAEENVYVVNADDIQYRGRLAANILKDFYADDNPDLDFRNMKYLLPLRKNGFTGYYTILKVRPEAISAGGIRYHFTLGEYHPLGNNVTQWEEPLEALKLYSIQHVTDVYSRNL